MLRQNLVGTMFEIADHEAPGSMKQVLVTEFLGEGAEGVILGIVPAREPASPVLALKIAKPAPFFEMQTLHHGFAVDTDRYPDHPLAMSPEARLAMLTAEMMPKVDDSHLLFRIAFYREIIDAAATVLAGTFADATGPVSLETSPTLEWLDDNLAHRLTELLDEDRVTPEFHTHVEHALDALEQAITRWQAAGTYAPASRNPLVTLTGLLFEDFISHDEYRFLSRSPEFAARVRPGHVEIFFQAIATFYYCIQDKEDKSRVSAASSACDLLLEVSTLIPDRAEWYVALARAWKARFLMLAKEPLDIVEPLLKSALDTWIAQRDWAQCHDGYKFLAAAHHPTDPETAVRYLNLAQRALTMLRDRG